MIHKEKRQQACIVALVLNIPEQNEVNKEKDRHDRHYFTLNFHYK